MNRRNIIIIIILVFIIFIIFAISIGKIQSNKENSDNGNGNNEKIEAIYDEVEGTYKIYDENHQLITTVTDESEVQFYNEHPEYRAEPPLSPNIEEQ